MSDEIFVGENGMFTYLGDQRVERLIQHIRYGLLNGKLLARKNDIEMTIAAQAQEISRDHPEVYDTEVRLIVTGKINDFLKENGFNVAISYHWPI